MSSHAYQLSCLQEKTKKNIPANSIWKEFISTSDVTKKKNNGLWHTGASLQIGNIFAPSASFLLTKLEQLMLLLSFSNA